MIIVMHFPSWIVSIWIIIKDDLFEPVIHNNRNYRFPSTLTCNCPWMKYFVFEWICEGYLSVHYVMRNVICMLCRNIKNNVLFLAITRGSTCSTYIISWNLIEQYFHKLKPSRFTCNFKIVVKKSLNPNF